MQTVFLNSDPAVQEASDNAAGKLGILVTASHWRHRRSLATALTALNIDSEVVQPTRSATSSKGPPPWVRTAMRCETTVSQGGFKRLIVDVMSEVIAQLKARTRASQSRDEFIPRNSGRRPDASSTWRPGDIS